MSFSPATRAPEVTAAGIPVGLGSDAAYLGPLAALESTFSIRLWDMPALTMTRWGTVKAAYGSGETEMEGVYAVGDIVRGASLVVWAIKDGRDCAEAILARLNGVKKVAAE